MRRFIDAFEVVLLDMGNTFMFGVDRFGEQEDYHATYRAGGGSLLSAENVRERITRLQRTMIAAARDPVRLNDYGDIYRFLEEAGCARDLCEEETERLVAVFAAHEGGHIPPSHAAALHALAATHRLGLISNIWAPKAYFEARLEAAGVLDLFDIRIWSSDTKSVKPSPHLFRAGLDYFGVAPARAVYVGDNPKRDVGGAKGVGMKAVWIRNRERPWADHLPAPDLVVDSLTELPEARPPGCPAGAMHPGP
jgi:putative hydrolase of the HAD superfamily/5'-nucleotidase